MIKKILTLFLLIILITSSAFSEPSTSYSRYSAVYLDSFDTVISFIAYAESEQAFQKTSTEVQALFRYLHKLFDCYNSYEDEGILSLYSLNAKAAIEPVEVDPVLFNLLSFSKTHYALTNGQTNIAMGAVLSIWHEYREAGLDNPASASLPPMDSLQAASYHTDIDDLVLDEEKHTVFYADPELKLDVGAVAKGYATEMVAQYLLAHGCTSFIISAGGNVRVGQPPMDGRPKWGVGIQDPDGAVYGSSSIVETLFLANTSVVTSGDYQRFYTVNGQNYCHLIDPDTLMPGNYFRSVTIITPDSGYADLLSTAAYLMPYEESREWIESLNDVEAIWLFPDGSEEMTEGASFYAKSRGAVNQ